MSAKRRKPVDGEKAMFIRSHPDVTAREVVALAKKAGLRFSVAYVQQVRFRDRDRDRRTAAKPHATPGTSLALFEPAPVQLSASDFVRSLPLDLPTEEALARGVALGLPRITKGIIYQVRSLMKRGKDRPPRKNGHRQGAAFIRGLPLSMPPDDVIAAGAEAGIVISPGSVWRVRREMEKAEAPRSGPGRRPTEASLFVDSQPRDMPASEVVARAAIEGIETTEKAVNNRRWKRAMAAKDRPTTEPGHEYGAKRAFVEAQPLTLSRDDVVTAAREAGFYISAGWVGQIRSKMRDASNGAIVHKTTNGARRVRSISPPPPPLSTSSHDDPAVVTLLKAAASEIGLSRAIGLLEAERDVIRLFLRSGEGDEGG